MFRVNKQHPGFFLFVPTRNVEQCWFLCLQKSNSHFSGACVSLFVLNQNLFPENHFFHEIFFLKKKKRNFIICGGTVLCAVHFYNGIYLDTKEKTYQKETCLKKRNIPKITSLYYIILNLNQRLLPMVQNVIFWTTQYALRCYPH